MLFRLRIFLYLALTALTTVSCSLTEVITTKTGKVQGFIEPSSISGKSVQKFTNIPYAEAPVGKLRFAKPEPKKPWNGIIKPSNNSIGCWHYDSLDLRAFVAQTNTKMTEDCLILNIWTQFPQKQKQDVMIYIHGGGYSCGLSGTYPGHNFVAVGDVILVTINYRLSALGFLTSGDERIKGNLGLYDQRLALKWVKENIASFGGNPESITIFGWSAGAACVSAHTLSSGSWPYFDRAITHSGGMLAELALATPKKAKKQFNTFINAVNCADNGELLECLQKNVTEADLKTIYEDPKHKVSSLFYKLVVDGDFLTDRPETLLEKGAAKEAMMGITKDESLLLFKHLPEANNTSVDSLDKLFNEHVNTTLESYSDDAITQAIELYSPENGFQSKREALEAIIEFHSDFMFCGVIEEAIVRSKSAASGDTYYFLYSHASDVPSPSLYPKGTFRFSAHGLDIVSIFGQPINNSIYSTDDQVLSMRMILYWTNFAKTGNPNVGIRELPIVIEGIDSLPQWPRFTESTRKYLDMESESRMVVKSKFREKYCEFMKDPEDFVRRRTTSVASKYKISGISALFLASALTIYFVNRFLNQLRLNRS